MKITTRITTLDGKTVNEFEKVRNIAREIGNSQPLKKITCTKESGIVEYQDCKGKHHSIKLSDTAKLPARVSGLLNEMSLYHWRGRIYSGDSSIFCEDFAKALKCLMEVLREVGSAGKPKRANAGEAGKSWISSEVLTDALEWLPNMMKAVGCYSLEDDMVIGRAIGRLS
jgi:hypothetical protein